jgi:hypothetical protein
MVLSLNKYRVWRVSKGMSDSLRGSTESVVDEILGGVGGEEFLLVSPSRFLLEGWVSVSWGLESPPVSTVLADDRVLSSLRDDFSVAWSAADLVAENDLRLIVSDTGPGSTVLVSGDRVWTVSVLGGTCVAMSTTDGELASEFQGFVEAELGNGSFDLRTPPRTQLLEELARMFSEEVSNDFESGIEVLGGLETGEVGAAHVALLVAALHGELLYDLGKWAEDTRFASRATLSRKKDDLEEHGLTTTEKVPVDVGRPRQRLRPGDELREDWVEAAVKQAVEVLG